MSIEPLPLLDLLRSWSEPPLSEGWLRLVGDCVPTLASSGSSSPDRVRAWQQLAMLFGDSGAPELCVVTALYGRECAGDVEPDQRDDALSQTLDQLHSHTNLALLDLGIAGAVAPGKYIRLPVLDTDVLSEPDAITTWLASFLAPIDRLSDGAELCVRIAAVRAKLAPRPEPFSVDSVSAIEL